MTRLLVVEDSPTQARELSMLLESEGFRVELARDGASGLARCRSTPFDAVLSDVVMPQMDGYELCRRIKTEPSIKDTPVILLTSLAEPMDIIKGLECGADNFITKPYDGDYLVGRIRRLLENKAMRGERKVAMGVDILLMGKRLTINSEKEQILDLLVSTFEEVLRSRQREYEARLNEETARESQRFLQSALDALSSHIAILDKSGKIVAVNASWRSWAEAGQWPWPDAGVGMAYLELWKSVFAVDPEQSERIAEDLQLLLGGNRKTVTLEYQARIKQGPTWFCLDATRFGEGLDPLIAVEHEDITRRKSLEQQLRQSQKMEAIGQLAGGVAHDFNNLLVVITSYTKLLLEQFGGESPVRPDLEEIMRAANDAASLTRQLLAFSRQQVLRPIVIDLNAVIGELEKMLRRVIGEDVECNTSLDPGLGHVKADPGQMQQILMNLAVNARDAMPSGGKLTIETMNVTLDDWFASSNAGFTPGRYVVMTVSDTGTGMDPETQARIFEPFFTTKDVGKGTGLGLSTVYGIVQQSGGQIWVDSELGRGTAFKVYLPRVDEAVGTEMPARERESAARATETVLLVEDNPAIRKVVSRVLLPRGYQVLEAADATRAREICARHRGTIHLLLTDVVMPQTTGVSLAEELAEVRPGMRVLFMSGYSRPLTERGAAHADTVLLEKPFTPDAIVRKVREVLDRPEPRRARS